jgi:hypothetical protein
MEYIIPIIIVVAIAGVLGYVYLQKKKKDAVVPVYNQMPPVTAGWTFVYSSNISGDASNFTFPKTDGVHYIITKAAGLAMGKTITMRFNIGGAGALKVADPNDIPPATLRVFIWGQTVNDRWWGNPKIDLTDGDLTLSIKIDSTVWTGVGGNPPTVQAPFNTVVANPYAMGWTMGGQYFAGHGVYCPEGTKTFRLISYTVS